MIGAIYSVGKGLLKKHKCLHSSYVLWWFFLLFVNNSRRENT